jgi:hypothetical protein
MSDDPAIERAEKQSAERAEADRRRRRARIFGDVLPETTGDDRADASERDVDREGNDDWLRRQVPPHHGG